MPSATTPDLALQSINGGMRKTEVHFCAAADIGDDRYTGLCVCVHFVHSRVVAEFQNANMLRLMNVSLHSDIK